MTITLRPSEEQAQKIKQLTEFTNEATASKAIFKAIERHEALTLKLESTEQALTKANQKISDLKTAISVHLNAQKHFKKLVK